MIEARNISKRFGDLQVLDDISAQFTKGVTNLIIGQSGSGKTVFLKCLIGLFNPDEGEVIYDNVVFNKMRDSEKKEIRKRKKGKRRPRVSNN